MKALILVGGFGTRLRPLTFAKPKPLVEFCNLPIVYHQIAALAAVGVDEVVLAVNYRPETMEAAIADIKTRYGVKVTVSLEDTPMGTAGPLALAREHLSDGAPFFVFNSDVTCNYPLKELLAFHTNHGKEGTIIVKEVEDPSKYGVVVADEDGKIDRFVEKPKKWVGNCINAGMYIFNPSILDRIPMKPTSIEREIFPKMASSGELYSMVLKGYWMDIGQPKDYLTGMCLHLAETSGETETKVPEGVTVIEPVLIDESATIEAGSLIGPNVVVGPDCTVKTGARVQRATLLGGSSIGAHCYVNSAIVGWKTVVQDWARVEGESVLGELVTVKTGVLVNGVTVCPNKSVGASFYEKGKIIL